MGVVGGPSPADRGLRLQPGDGRGYLSLVREGIHVARIAVPPEIDGMNVTPQEMELLRAMTPARKLALMNSLIGQGWDLRAAGLRITQPALSKDEIQILARRLVAEEPYFS